MNYYFPAQVLPAKKRSFWRHIDPRIRLVSFFFFLLLVLVVPSKNCLALASLFLSLALMAALGGFSLKFFGKTAAFTLPWLAFVYLTILFKPKSLTGLILANFSTKMILTLILLTVYKEALNYVELISALSQTRVPPLFVSLLFLSHHFLEVLGEEAQRMNHALVSRSRGKINFRRRIKILWGLVNCLFDRAFWRCQQLLASMLSRGFTGHWPSLTRRRLTRADFLFLFFLFLLIIFLVVI